MRYAVLSLALAAAIQAVPIPDTEDTLSGSNSPLNIATGIVPTLPRDLTDSDSSLPIDSVTDAVLTLPRDILDSEDSSPIEIAGGVIPSVPRDITDSESAWPVNSVTNAVPTLPRGITPLEILEETNPGLGDNTKRDGVNTVDYTTVVDGLYPGVASEDVPASSKREELSEVDSDENQFSNPPPLVDPVSGVLSPEGLGSLTPRQLEDVDSSSVPTEIVPSLGSDYVPAIPALRPREDSHEDASLGEILSHVQDILYSGLPADEKINEITDAIVHHTESKRWAHNEENYNQQDTLENIIVQLEKLLGGDGEDGSYESALQEIIGHLQQIVAGLATPSKRHVQSGGHVDAFSYVVELIVGLINDDNFAPSLKQELRGIQNQLEQLRPQFSKREEYDSAYESELNSIQRILDGSDSATKKIKKILNIIADHNEKRGSDTIIPGGISPSDKDPGVGDAAFLAGDHATTPLIEDIDRIEDSVIPENGI